MFASSNAFVGAVKLALLAGDPTLCGERPNEPQADEGKQRRPGEATLPTLPSCVTSGEGTKPLKVTKSGHDFSRRKCLNPSSETVR